jgi:murein DD-endopeptidase MepM/ murein hydrolase activator NlpD
MLKSVAVAAFLAGLLLWVRVMFFGVRRQVGEHVLHHRRWPLALSAFLVVAGVLGYWRAGTAMSTGWAILILSAAALAGLGAWMLVAKSAAIPSTDPEDDPRYRFQGHVARVVKPITGVVADAPGRITFQFDGRTYEFGARWAPEADLGGGQLASAPVDSEVVIEFIDGDMAFVEPWVVVEKRL